MGFSCTNAALRTLQAIKATHGGDLAPSNEVRLHGRLAFFERGEEEADGAIAGKIVFLNRGERRFRIKADGTIETFYGVNRRLVAKRLADPAFRPTVAVI